MRLPYSDPGLDLSDLFLRLGGVSNSGFWVAVSGFGLRGWICQTCLLGQQEFEVFGLRIPVPRFGFSAWKCPIRFLHYEKFETPDFGFRVGTVGLDLPS